MADRIRFVTYRDKQILLIDLSQCTLDEMRMLLAEIQDTITSQPLDSVLVMTDFTGVDYFGRDLGEDIKKTLVFDRPYVKRAAWVGADVVPHAHYESFKSFSRRELPMFATREEAMEWLVGE